MVLAPRFAAFCSAFPPANAGDEGRTSQLSGEVASELGVSIPPILEAFWREVGCGYFGRNSILFFGSRSHGTRSLVAWNLETFWRRVFPSARLGGPVFFGETAFGEQLGFRWEGPRAVPILFLVDTFESFVLAADVEALFVDVLTEPGALFDVDLLTTVEARLGPLPPGFHYAPVVSPLVGGSASPTNFLIDDPVVHFETAIATAEAIHS